MSSYVIDMKPKSVLSKTAAGMVRAGFSIENRSNDSITFALRPGMDRIKFGGMVLDSVLGGMDFMAQNVGNQTTAVHTATMVAAPTPDGKTEIAVGGTQAGQQVLDQFIRYQLLFEHIPEAMAAFDGKKATLLVYNDSVVANKKGGMRKWQEGPFHVSEIEGVTLDGPAYKKTILIANRDGETITVPYVDYEQADYAVRLIEERKGIWESLGTSDGEADEEVKSGADRAEASGEIDIPDQIRKLAELRDLGIVTDDEFEVKKTELLARM